MMFSTLRLAYSLLLMLLLPIIFFRLWWRGRYLPAYRQRWAERLGIVSFIVDKKGPLKPIWVHAASVGEVLSAIPLIKRLQSQYPNTPILITTITPAGSERVQVHFRNELNNTIFHSYLPYDVAFIIRRFLNDIDPKYLIIIETELWPNLLYIAHQKKIPIMIANARLSPRSVKHYQHLGWIMRVILNSITVVVAQSALDAKRYASIGMVENRITNIGNIKYDLKLPDNIISKGLALRQIWDKNRPVWIAASTHQGEESLILSIFSNLQKKYPRLLLLLVPRHPDRFEEVYQLCLAKKLSIIRRTDLNTHLKTIEFPEIFLGDTMGDLLEYYAASDFVFMGGSLVPVGGHNFLEPAALGLPIVIGPYHFNFAEMSEDLLANQGLKIVQNVQALEDQISDFLDYPKEAQQIGQAAKNVVQQNRGALDRLIILIGKTCNIEEFSV